MSAVCRVCLAGNTRLRSLINNLLIDVYEIMSNTKFNCEDGRPRVICQYCYRKLLRCHTFSQMAHRSEKIFDQIYNKGFEATHEYITEKNLGIDQQLSVTALQFVAIDGNATDAGSQVTIKDEPVPGIDIKEEVTTNQDKLVEVWSVAEDCTGSQLKLEEDGEEELPSNNHVERTKKDNSKMTLCCHNCNKIFFHKSRLISHLRNSHSQIKGNRIDHVLEQTRMHTGEKPFACNVCDKQYNQKYSLNTHIIRTHTGEKLFACNLCDRQYYQKRDLVQHTRYHTSQKTFACNVCDKRFNRNSKLVAHMRIHTGEKPFACNVCDKQFNNKNNLLQHTRTHTGLKPFACNVCDKRFNRKEHLVGHMSNHTGEKLFACSVCERRFNYKCDLIRHIKIHTGEKLFACDLCDKQFNKNSNLVLHTRTHTREKSFACTVCDKRFKQKCYLIRHIKIHTGEKPFACSACDKRFNQKSYLMKHVRIHK